MPRSWVCTICKLPCHRLKFDSYQQKAFSSLKGLDSDALYFSQDGSFSDRAKLVFKSKGPAANQITDELAIDVPDVIQQEVQSSSSFVDSLVLHPFVSSSSFNVEDYTFFKKLLSDDSGRSVIEDLSNKLIESLRLTDAEVSQVITGLDL